MINIRSKRDYLPVTSNYSGEYVWFYVESFTITHKAQEVFSFIWLWHKSPFISGTGNNKYLYKPY